MELMDIWVIMRRGQYPCNNPALRGHAQAFVRAKAFDRAVPFLGIDSLYRSRLECLSK